MVKAGEKIGRLDAVVLNGDGEAIKINLAPSIEQSIATDLSKRSKGEKQMSEESIEKSMRYRVNVSISTKGQKTWDCTCDGVGYTEEEVLAESDSLVAKLDKRYPAPAA